MVPQEHRRPLPIEVAASLKLSASCLRSFADDLYWIEGRPELDGARVVMRVRPDGDPEIVSPPGLSLSSRVHEYGGGAICLIAVDGEPVVVGVRAVDQAIVTFHPRSGAVTEVVHEEASAFGDLSWGPGHGVVAVRERSTPTDVVRDVVHVDLASGTISSLTGGRDFYSDPRVHADGRMAWCAWDHPAMPWDASEVWTGRLDGSGGDLALVATHLVAGGVDRPAGSPVLLSDGTLALALEDGDRAQLWRWSTDGGLEPLSHGGGEVGQPLWILGTTSVATDGRTDVLACVERTAGRSEVSRLEGRDLIAVAVVPGAVDEIVSTSLGLGVLGTGDEHLGYVAWIQGGEMAGWRPLGPQVSGPVSRAEPIRVEADDGREVHGLLFPPSVPTSEAPPVVVFCHGGPTGQALPGLNPLIEALTSRGLCVVAANYAGSTGFGAAYRHRLDGRWGVADVDDCVALVAGLAEQGRVDGTRAAIRGTSAGGLTALLGLTTGAFVGAVSWYGVADLVTLAESTHDFESRYLDRLIGPLPEDLEVYRDRSPINRASQMRGAALLLQGLDDPVVPPAQATSMAAAMRANGHEVELIEFPGESHGFRRLDTLVDAFTAEVTFYERHLGATGAADSIALQ